jgi:hypothetical protein
LLSVWRASLARRAGHAYRQDPGGWKVEAVEVDFWHPSVEADCFVCE